MIKPPNPTSAAGNGRSPTGVHAGISAQLRAFYRSVEEEAIPDRFLALLEKLDMAEKQADNKHGVEDTAR